MCDSFDTPRALQLLLDLVSQANIYLARGRKNVNVSTLLAVAEWVTRMLRMFGLGEGSPTDGKGERVVGWGVEVAEGQEQGDVSRLLCLRGCGGKARFARACALLTRVSLSFVSFVSSARVNPPPLSFDPLLVP